MPVLNDEAVVLRLTDFSETSQIATLFSAAHGQLRLIAKGARRSTKQRFATGLDLLEYGELGFVPARGDAQLGTLTDWTQRESFAGLRRALLRLYVALYAAELVPLLTEELDPHPELFTALLETLRGLATEAPAGPRLVGFQLALLRAVGYLPELHACVCCRRPISRGPVYFSAGAGGLLCRDCEGHYQEKRWVRAELAGGDPSAGDARAWFELLDYHITHIAGRRPQTARGVEKLLARDR